MAGERIAFQGLPARICWIGLGERHRAGLAFNEMVKTGELKAPIVIGRDHLDSRLGRVSPNRETEAMQRRHRRGLRLAAAQRAAQHRRRRDLGRRCTTAAASAWATRSTPAWSSSATARDAAAKRIERVLWNDPATGVMRHADAGYDDAVACAREQGLNLPMLGALMPLAASQPGTADARRAAGDPRRRRRRSTLDADGARGDPRQRRGRRSARRRATRAVYGVNTGFGKLASTRIERRRARDAAAEPDPLARGRRRRAAAAAGGAADARAQGGEPGARPLGRARGGRRHAARRCTTPAWCRTSRAQGSVGASGDLAPLAHLTLALIGEGEMLVDGERVPAAPALRARRHRAAGARGQGRPGADQRHAGLDRAGAARAAGVRAGARGGAGRRRADGRRGARQRRPVRSAHPRAARPARADRRRPVLPRAARRQRDPPLAPRGRRPRAGPVQPALPAAGGRRLPRPAAPRGAGAAARGQRGHRQPAGLRRADGDEARSSRAATSTPSRWRWPPTRWRSRSPRSARSPSGASRC